MQRSSWLHMKETSLFPGPFVCKAGFLANPLGCSGCLAGNKGQALRLQMGLAGLDAEWYPVSQGKRFDRTPALACWLVCLRNPLEECFCSFNPLTFPQTPLLYPLFVHSSSDFTNFPALIKCQEAHSCFSALTRSEALVFGAIISQFTDLLY